MAKFYKKDIDNFYGTNDFYKVIADIDEIEWFYNHVIPKPKTGESLLLCHSARKKHCSTEEVEYLKIVRSGMFHVELSKPRPNQDYNWNDFIGSIHKFETNVYAYTTKTYQPYPDKTLVLFMYLNPCSDALSVLDTMKTTFSIIVDLIHAAVKFSWTGVTDSVYKMSTLTSYMKSCYARNPASKEFIDFDIDWPLKEDDYGWVHEITEKFFKKGNFFMVKTAGGMHILVKQKALKFNPEDYLSEIKSHLASKWNGPCEEGDIVWNGTNIYKAKVSTKNDAPSSYQSNDLWEVIGEIKKNDNTMCAIPGTWQYGTHCVRIVNKEDFSC